MVADARIIYFTPTPFEELINGPTANYYDHHLANLASIEGGLVVLHLGIDIPTTWLNHPRISGVRHLVPRHPGRVTVRSLTRWIVAFPPQLLHAKLLYLPFPSIASVIAWTWKRSGRTVIYQRLTALPALVGRANGNRGKRQWIDRASEWAAIRGSDFLGVGSEQLRSHALDKGAHFAKIALTTNLVEIDQIPRKRDFRLTSPPLLVAVGRLEKEKRFEWLIEAVRGLDIRLEIYGVGSGKARLEELASHLGANAHLVGTLPNQDLMQRLASADVFLCASRIEVVPKALLEAMAIGLPIVACRESGVAEWLVGGRGYLTEPTPDALRAGIGQILKDISLRVAVGCAASEYARVRHNAATVLRQDREHVQRALATIASAPAVCMAES
jgi:glycosyltransferase involved in cell wall biosynthesis